MTKGVILAVAGLSLVCQGSLLAETQKWKESKSTHFVISYQGAEEAFINKVIDHAENYYDRIADNLGLRRFDFWLWDKRARIYIYDNAVSYQEATGQISWSAGCARVSEKMIMTYVQAEGFFDAVLPHEMGHIIFRELVGFNNPAIPVWLEEGVAGYQQVSSGGGTENILRDAVMQGRIIPLAEMNDQSKWRTSNNSEINLLYAQAVSIVGYLIKDFGKEKFVAFCQYLRDKQDIARAMAMIYNFTDIQELDRAWQRCLGINE